MTRTAAIIGAGPAGLMAAEILAGAGISVTVFERKPSPARKFLMAGRGGLNLTHSEDINDFIKRYGDAAAWLAPHIKAFTPSDLRAWCEGLGEETFVGSSGRVFPKSFKASPLLRAWLARLDKLGVVIRYNAEWQGWDKNGKPVINGASVPADATLLALGGASWPRLGSDGGWTSHLTARGVTVSPLRPTNCGFVINWSDVFSKKFAGQPVKPLAITCNGKTVMGEAMVTAKGIEGGAVYALSSTIRGMIEDKGKATFTLDLAPNVSVEKLQSKLETPRRGMSLANYLRKEADLNPVAIGLVNEAVHGGNTSDLATLIKSLPLITSETAPIDRAISSAGGIELDEIDADMMLKNLPGVFVAGEMLDWEAPTGGYLLQATFATAVTAAHGISAYLKK